MQHLSIVTASLDIAHLPSLCLRQKAQDVPDEIFPETLRSIIEGMVFSLYSSGGVGLAAPQVGIGWRLFLAMERDPNASPMILINPKFVDMSEEIEEGREGCLSLPGYFSTKVPRSKVVKVEALNQFLEPVQIEAHDFLARVFQHEYDHLDGILYTDRLKSLEDLEATRSAEERARETVEHLYARPETAPQPDM
jgi:peptide deformylase